MVADYVERRNRNPAHPCLLPQYLERQEDDQLFIDESSSSRAMEQRQLIAKVNKINPLVKLAGATSGLMMLAIAGWAVYLRLWYSLKVGGIRSPGVRDINGPTIGSSKNIL
jgi:hypothetical protein